nr:SEL1-like repeat protein [Succinivibrionaceae bacterium]
HGSTDAEYSLGHMYSCGQGVQRDNEKAIEWFRRAAAHGSADARRRIQNILRSMGKA